MKMFDWKEGNYSQIIKERDERLQSIRQDSKLLQASAIFYRSNPIEFIEDWMWTYDPRKLSIPDASANVPFLLFPRQKEYILWLDERVRSGEDGLVEKSRDMGVTYLNCAYATWCFLFKEGFKISFGSRKEALVDQLGNPDSILEKIRMILRYIPPEFLPMYFGKSAGKYQQYDEGKDATFLRIVNKQNGASITGEAGDNIGRGGRSTLYFKDESAFYERPERIDAALSQNSDVKIDVSTPNGNGNPFFKKRFSGAIPVFTFHWKDDPRKDQVWYDDQKRRHDPVTVAQEIDIDYNASVEDICIPSKWVEACIDSHIKLEFEPSGMKRAGLDVADEGEDENSLIMAHGSVVFNVQSWKEGTTTQTARKAYNECESNKVQLMNYDSIGVGAGVKGGLNDYISSKSNPIEVSGVNVGSTELSGFWCDEKRNKDMFMNLKAKLWWNIRERCKKTYENVNGKEDHPTDELLSIPNNSKLIQQLSQPKRMYSETGKIQIEPKKSLKKRGIKSHNEADALVLCFANEIKNESGVW